MKIRSNIGILNRILYATNQITHKQPHREARRAPYKPTPQNSTRNCKGRDTNNITSRIIPYIHSFSRSSF